VGYFWPKVEDWERETIFCGHYRSIFNNSDEIALKAIKFGEKTQNKGYYPFKVMQGHRGRY